MLISMNALSIDTLPRFGPVQSWKMQDNNVFKDKNTNRLHNTKQTARKNLSNPKKRSFGDVGMDKTVPQKLDVSVM